MISDLKQIVLTYLVPYDYCKLVNQKSIFHTIKRYDKNRHDFEHSQASILKNKILEDYKKLSKNNFIKHTYKYLSKIAKLFKDANILNVTHVGYEFIARPLPEFYKILNTRNGVRVSFIDNKKNHNLSYINIVGYLGKMDIVGLDHPAIMSSSLWNLYMFILQMKNNIFH